MKIFTQEELEQMTPREIEILRANIMVSTASHELKTKNLDEINIAVNGGVKYTNKQVLEDIKAGLPDTSDMEGHSK